jgi:hypothetical protein
MFSVTRELVPFSPRQWSTHTAKNSLGSLGQITVFGDKIMGRGLWLPH